jgi:hypothetical protein
MTNPLFSLWETERVKPLYDLLKALPPDEAYALMTDLHAAERRAVLGPMHAQSMDWVRSRIALAPLLAERYDIDVLAAQFADYVFELNLDSAFLSMLMSQPEKLAEVVDMGNFDVLEAAVAGERPVLVTPLHYGPVYAASRHSERAGFSRSSPSTIPRAPGRCTCRSPSWARPSPRPPGRP